MEKNEQPNSEQNIELIQSMISYARKKYESTGGRFILLWGYISLAVGLTGYVLYFYFDLPWAGLIFLLIPILGTIFHYILQRKTPEPVITYLDRIISNTWIVAGATSIALAVALRISGMSHLALPIIATIFGITALNTGLTIKSNPTIFAGITAIILSMLSFIIPNHANIIFIAVIVFAIILPGHLLIRKK